MVDILKVWSGKPFLFAGMNSIVMYVGHEMTGNNFPVRWNLHEGQSHPTHFISLFENMWGTGFWIVVAYYLFKIDCFYAL